jgi:RNA:NAD 2'-phosphotransferase (TPT1/KptA family)
MYKYLNKSLNQGRFIAISKFLCKILQHAPEEFDIKLDVNHSCKLEKLFEATDKYSDFTREEVSYVLLTSKWEDILRFKIYNERVKATFKHTYHIKKVS